MSDKNRKILAYIGLAFMAVFSVTFVMFLIKPAMLNGGIAFIALFSFACGLTCFFIVRGRKTDAQDEEFLIGGDGDDADIDADGKTFDSDAAIDSDDKPNGNAAE